MRIIFFLIFISLLFGCRYERKIAEYKIDKNDIIDNHFAKFSNESYDKNGSIVIFFKNKKEKVYKLYKFKNTKNLSGSILAYNVYAKSENLKGEAYIEMICNIKGNDYFSKALDNKIDKSGKWKEYKTLFFLKKDENPKEIYFNLIVKGKGKIWIDKISLTKRKQKVYPL